MCGDSVENHRILGQRMNQSQGMRPKAKKGITVSVMKCSNCGLIYSNPQPIPYDMQDHYGVPPESYWYNEYFTANPHYFSNQIGKAKKFLSFQPGMKALDIGAGLGKAMIAMENAGFDAYGFEASVPFYDRAIEKMGISPQKLKRAALEEVDYQPETFDFISFGAVLEHLYDADLSIAKAMTWLKPNGIIHIEVPSSDYTISKIFNFYYRLRGTNYVTNISPMHSPFHMYEFGLGSFTKNQKKHQYKIVYHEYYVCDILGIPKIFRPMLKWYMKKRNTGMQLEIWLKKGS